MSDVVKRLQRRAILIGMVGSDPDLKLMLEDAAAEITRLREERRWVPVKERLPPTDTEVLLTCKIDGDFTDVSIGRSIGRMNDIGSAVIMDLDGDGDWVTCTHWKPKPLPPGPENKEVGNVPIQK